MPLASVEFYDIIRWLHITSVVLAFGPTFAFGIVLAYAQRTDPRALPAVLGGNAAVSRTLVTIGGIVVFATGLYLTIDGPWGFDDVFVNVGMLAAIGLLGLLHGFFIPNDRRTAEAARRDIEESRGAEIELGSEFERRTRASARVGMLAGLVVVVTIYFMTAKPFL